MFKGDVEGFVDQLPGNAGAVIASGNTG